jgi:hypothetical protein
MTATPSADGSPSRTSRPPPSWDFILGVVVLSLLAAILGASIGGSLGGLVAAACCVASMILIRAHLTSIQGWFRQFDARHPDFRAAVVTLTKIAIGLAVLAFLLGVVLPEATTTWVEQRAPSYVRSYRPSPDSPRTIADGIEYHTHPSFGMQMGSWSAVQQKDGSVAVTLAVRYTSNDTAARAEWVYDPKTGIVTPSNPLASYLSTKDEPR